MKKIFSILAIAVVSLNFVSCRQDDDITSQAESTIQVQNKVESRVSNNPVSADSATVKVAAREETDPPKDRTGW